MVRFAEEIAKSDLNESYLTQENASSIESCFTIFHDEFTEVGISLQDVENLSQSI